MQERASPAGVREPGAPSVQERASAAGVREHRECRSTPPLQVSGSREHRVCGCSGGGSTAGRAPSRVFPEQLQHSPEPPSHLLLHHVSPCASFRGGLSPDALALPLLARHSAVSHHQLPHLSSVSAPSRQCLSLPLVPLEITRSPTLAPRRPPSVLHSSSLLSVTARCPPSALCSSSVLSVTPHCCLSLPGTLRPGLAPRHHLSALRPGSALSGSPLSAVRHCSALSVQAQLSSSLLSTLRQPFVWARCCSSAPECCASLFDTLHLGSALRYAPLALRSVSVPSVRLSVLSVTARQSPSGLGPSARYNSRSSRLGPVHHHPSAARVSSAPRPFVQARRRPSAPQCCSSVLGTLRPGSAPPRALTAVRQDSAPSIIIRQQFV
ncbi:uncharacterized protein LOC115937651 [Leptonychotes weddellii]|uniref:Uncharacterized protein LOC115937651 n=1 Tax=Leptonychotes weddellii TaxID=9713 RepID=A0A7F8Q6D5_LEPWE|nr:uncharacterized protein LOC115937651 [Leptonychotes weddellii]